MEDQNALQVRLEEYKTLREETLKRIDARNLILSYTLAFAAAMFTLALSANGFISALLIYPFVAFFFATLFAYNSLMLIHIGSYLRMLEGKIPGTGWATHLRPIYGLTELFELASSAGLFLGTEIIGVILYFIVAPAEQRASPVLIAIALTSIGLTLGAVVYPWFFHRRLQRAEAQ